MNARTTVRLPNEVPEYALPELVTSAALQAEFEQAKCEDELRACTYCQTEGHDIWWRAYPVTDPGPCPPGDVLDGLVESCHCCLFGKGPTRTGEPLLDRLEREAHRGRDIQIDHRDKAGRWAPFERTF